MNQILIMDNVLRIKDGKVEVKPWKSKTTRKIEKEKRILWHKQRQEHQVKYCHVHGNCKPSGYYVDPGSCILYCSCSLGNRLAGDSTEDIQRRLNLPKERRRRDYKAMYERDYNWND